MSGEIAKNRRYRGRAGTAVRPSRDPQRRPLPQQQRQHQRRSPLLACRLPLQRRVQRRALLLCRHIRVNPEYAARSRGPRHQPLLRHSARGYPSAISSTCFAWMRLTRSARGGVPASDCSISSAAPMRRSSGPIRSQAATMARPILAAIPRNSSACHSERSTPAAGRG